MEGFFSTFSGRRRRILSFRMIWKRSLYLFSHQISRLLWTHNSLSSLQWLQETFWIKSMTFEVLNHLLAWSEHTNLVLKPPTKQRKQIAVTVWALVNQEIYTCHQILNLTGLRELSGQTSWAGLVWPEPVLSVFRTRTLHSRMHQSGRPVVTNGMCLSMIKKKKS